MLQILLAHGFSSLVFLHKHSKASSFVKGAFRYSNQVVYIFLFNTFEEERKKNNHQTIPTQFKPREHLKLSDSLQIFILSLLLSGHIITLTEQGDFWSGNAKTSAPNYFVNTKPPNLICSSI